LTIEAMLDANLCIRVLRDRPTQIRERFMAEAPGLAISTIVLHELFYGAERSDRPALQHQNVAEFADHLTVLDFNREAARHASEIKATLAARGKLIGPNDLLIAGHARSLGLKLITGNLGEFSRVDGLHCEDWFAPETSPTP
jgi:tRNA(fMet)-specific endonuclease VapC